MNDCVTQTQFMTHPGLRDRPYSKRFHFALCKMLDGGLSQGTTMMCGIRATMGWGQVPEPLFPSDRSLPEKEYGDWQKIPKEAWEFSRQMDRAGNRTFFGKKFTFKKLAFLHGRKFHFLSRAFPLYDSSYVLEWRVISGDFDSVGWTTLRFLPHKNDINFEEFFIKPEFRKMGIGTKLIKFAEGCIAAGFMDPWLKETLGNVRLRDHFTHIKTHAPKVDIYTPERKEAVVNFFKKNGYNLSIDQGTEARGEMSKLLISKSLATLPKSGAIAKIKFLFQ